MSTQTEAVVESFRIDNLEWRHIEAANLLKHADGSDLELSKGGELVLLKGRQLGMWLPPEMGPTFGLSAEHVEELGAWATLKATEQEAESEVDSDVVINTVTIEFERIFMEGREVWPMHHALNPLSVLPMSHHDNS